MADLANPYRMAELQGEVLVVRPDEGCRCMDQISMNYKSEPFPSRGPDRVCFVIAVTYTGTPRSGLVEPHSRGVPEGGYLT